MGTRPSSHANRHQVSTKPDNSSTHSIRVQKSSPSQRVTLSGSLAASNLVTSQKSRTVQAKSIASILLAIALLLLSATSVVGCGWFALQLIVKPQSLSWINRTLPGWISTHEVQAPAQSLDDIRKEIRQLGFVVGDPIALGKNVSFLDNQSPTSDLLLPVLQRTLNCQTDCDRIVELRVYQTAVEAEKVPKPEPTYYLVSQLAIAGLEESFVIAPIVDAQSENQGSSRSLPLTQLSRFEGTVPSQGVWLNLSGQRNRGGEAIAYGQIIYYHPKHLHLGTKLNWTSPPGEPPIWKEVTGKGTPELIVNHTIGMEPQFEIYQVKPLNFIPSPLQLEQISLAAPALNNPTYQSAMLLARNQLWSTSLQWLTSLKRRTNSKQWSSAAQAQLDLVQWHAQATQTQAEGSWASPAQQVLANLIDGRWERALTVFEASAAASYETADVLKADSGRLENRVQTALRLYPNKPEVKAWGALLMTAQHDRATAIVWLKKQPGITSANVTRIGALIQRLDPAFVSE